MKALSKEILLDYLIEAGYFLPTNRTKNFTTMSKLFYFLVYKYISTHSHTFYLSLLKLANKKYNKLVLEQLDKVVLNMLKSIMPISLSDIDVKRGSRYEIQGLFLTALYDELSSVDPKALKKWRFAFSKKTAFFIQHKLLTKISDKRHVDMIREAIKQNLNSLKGLYGETSIYYLFARTVFLVFLGTAVYFMLRLQTGLDDDILKQSIRKAYSFATQAVSREKMKAKLFKYNKAA